MHNNDNFTSSTSQCCHTCWCCLRGSQTKCANLCKTAPGYCCCCLQDMAPTPPTPSGTCSMQGSTTVRQCTLMPVISMILFMPACMCLPSAVTSTDPSLALRNNASADARVDQMCISFGNTCIGGPSCFALACSALLLAATADHCW